MYVFPSCHAVLLSSYPVSSVMNAAVYPNTTTASPVGNAASQVWIPQPDFGHLAEGEIVSHDCR